MLPSGVAWLGGDEWSITAELSDLSYLIAPQSAQEEVLNRWARWLNGFSGGTNVQLTVTNEVLDSDSFGRLARMRFTGDPLDTWREQFNTHVTSKLSTRRGNVYTRRYLTITITEPDADKAEERLLRLVSESAGNLRQLDSNGGVTIRALDRPERLALISSLLRPGEPFEWSEERFDGGKSTTRDAVTPWTVEDKSNHLILTSGGRPTFHTTVWLRDLPPWLSDRVVSDLAAIRGNLTLSLHARPFDAAEGLDLVRGQIASLEMQLLTEQKKASRQNYSLDLIPARLTDARNEAIALRQDLQSSNQRVWSTCLIVGVSAASQRQMDALVEQVTAVLRTHSCSGEVLSWMMLDALRSELPLGARRLPMERTLTTSALAALHPFTTQELIQPNGKWYGANARSGNPLLVARRDAMNQNGFVVGTTGSGKSMAAKCEAIIARLTTDDDVIFLDPENEYAALTRTMGGQVVTISAAGTDHINAMDLSMDSAADDPIMAKSLFVLGLIGALVGGNSGLSPSERSVVDRSTVALLRRYAANPSQSAPPTLADLRSELEASKTEEGARLALSLDIYTSGSLSAFAQQTNVNLNDRLLCYELSQLSPELRPIGMMIVLDQIWGRVTANRARGRRTWLYVDEFHLFFRYPDTADAFLTFYQRARKWGLVVTGITQNIEEVLASRKARLMLGNADFLQILNQSHTDASALSDLLKLSDEQRECFSGVPAGTGLLKSGGSFLPFDNQMDPESALYKLLTTRFEEVTR